MRSHARSVVAPRVVMPILLVAGIWGGTAVFSGRVSMGLLISDKQAGPFRLEVARIGAYAE
jgi:hypothetical protein